MRSGGSRSTPEWVRSGPSALLAGIELHPDALARKPGLTDAVVAEARRRGVLTRNLVGKSLQVSPPFVIEEAEIRLLVDTFAASIDAALA